MIYWLIMAFLNCTVFKILNLLPDNYYYHALLIRTIITSVIVIPKIGIINKINNKIFKHNDEFIIKV